MSTFRIGRTEHITLGGGGIDSKVDAFIRDLGNDPERLTDALRDTLIYFAEADIEAEDEAAEERKDIAENVIKLEEAVATAESRLEKELQKAYTLQKRCQELLKENAALRIQLRGEPADLDAIIQSSTNVIKPTFGDNAARAYSLYCQASQVDEQDPFEAAQLYRRAIALDPKLAIAWTNLGNCHYRLNRTERAIECWQKALTIEPRQPEAHFNLGHNARERGDDTEAEKHLKNAINSDNRFSDAYYTLGALYIKQRKPAKAQACFERFLALDPNSIFADDVRKMLKGEK